MGFQRQREVRKGCVAVKVGQGAEQRRFLVPVVYINHPLFMQLLKDAEEEFGFQQKGPITIPCRVDDFLDVQGIIHHHYHHHHHLMCFRV